MKDDGQYCVQRAELMRYRDAPRFSLTQHRRYMCGRVPRLAACRLRNAIYLVVSRIEDRCESSASDKLIVNWMRVDQMSDPRPPLERLFYIVENAIDHRAFERIGQIEKIGIVRNLVVPRVGMNDLASFLFCKIAARGFAEGF